MREMQLLGVQLVVLAMMLAAPAVAGGPLEAPDDTGPSATDFTGWTPVAFVYGGYDGATTRSRVLCLNVGTVSTDVAVQWYDDGDNPARQPVVEAVLDIPPSDLDADASVTNGTANTHVFARVLVSERKASIHCAGRTEESGAPSSSLEVVYLKKIPKARIAKR